MFHVVYGFLYLLSLLPLGILFLLSDFAYILLYFVFAYRKKVVMSNLTIAFPEKSEEEKVGIAKKFYRNFTDNFIEVIKLISANKEFIDNHFKGDYSAFHKVFAEGKKSHVFLGHTFNWELANLAVAANIQQKLLTVYMPVQNKIFEKLFLKIRSKTGAALLPASDVRKSIMTWRNSIYTIALVADQNPPIPNKAYWIEFFGRPTAFLKGPESGARIADLPVIFCYFTKEKRGRYTGYFSIGEENPGTLEKGALTVKYVRFLEQAIRENPDLWLWSHRRWKHEWKPEYGTVLT